MDTVVATIAVGNQPFGIAMDPSGSRAYVANNADATLTIIQVGPVDPTDNLVLATVAVSAGPIGVSVDPTGRRVHVASLDADVDNVFDENGTPITSVPVGSRGLLRLGDS